MKRETSESNSLDMRESEVQALRERIRELEIEKRMLEVELAQSKVHRGAA